VTLGGVVQWWEGAVLRLQSMTLASRLWMT
jgi:hypothetical protein